MNFLKKLLKGFKFRMILTSDLKNVTIYEKHLNKEKILKKIKKKI